MVLVGYFCPSGTTSMVAIFALLFSAAQCIAVQCNEVWCSAVKASAAQCNAAN